MIALAINILFAIMGGLLAYIVLTARQLHQTLTRKSRYSAWVQAGEEIGHDFLALHNAWQEAAAKADQNVRTAPNDPTFWRVTSPDGHHIVNRVRLREVSDKMGWNHNSMKSSAIRRGKYLNYTFERI